MTKWSEKALSATMADADTFNTTVGGNSRRVAKTTIADGLSVLSSGSTDRRTLSNRFASVVDVKDFGAVGDGATDDTTAFQAAVDYAETGIAASPQTAGVVMCPFGEYLLGSVTAKDRVFIGGYSPQEVTFKARNSLNTHLFISDGFNTLTGTNKWNAVDGVLSYLGFFNCRIFGNDDNNTSGDGIRFYAKGLYFHNVLVSDFAGNGLYTEAGEDPSVSAWQTWPEGNTSFLQTARNGGHGWHMRGPHDMYCGKVTSFINGGDGVRLQSSSGNYLATTDFTFLHCYSNTGRGLYVVASNYRASELRLENNHQEGLYHENCDNSQLGIVQLLDNGRTSGDYQGVIDANSSINTISNLSVRRSGRAAAGGFQLNGVDNQISGHIAGDVTGGGNSTGVGLDIPSGASYCRADVTVSDFSGVGATGLRTANGGQIIFCDITAILRSNTTQFNNVTQGTDNKYRITGNTAASNTSFTGADPADGESWDVILRKTGQAPVRSHNRIEHATTVDLNITTSQTFTIPHKLLAAPPLRGVNLQLSYTGSVDVPPYSLTVTSAGVTNVIGEFKLDTAMGASEVGNIILDVAL